MSFEEAKSVFYDDFARQFYDEPLSEGAERFLLLGKCAKSRILLICHCELDSTNVIRLISARKATTKEKKLYEGPKK